MLSDTLPADKARFQNGEQSELTKLFSEGFPVLLPVMDLLNYKPMCAVEWVPRNSYVALQVHDQYHAGQEVFNNYGALANEICEYSEIGSYCA